MNPVSYHNNKFPPKKLEWDRLIPCLGRAHKALGGYDAMLSHSIKNPNLLLKPIVSQEATLSSKIEGTQATIHDLFGYEADKSNNISFAMKSDIKEIINYRSALRSATLQLKKLPISRRVIVNIHRTLMKGLPIQRDAPSELRKNQNWIGSPGSTIKNASYIPISPQYLEDGMGALEKFINDDYPDSLVQCAIMHAEFEALHPFLDGNGRVGRILIPLFLADKKVISKPHFYLSPYIESHKQEYYQALLNVSKNNDWTSWCIYFIDAIYHQAIADTATLHDLAKLYQSMKEDLPIISNSKYAINVIDEIFNRPYFSIASFKNINKKTAQRIIDDLTTANYIKKIAERSGRAPSRYRFTKFLSIIRPRK